MFNAIKKKKKHIFVVEQGQTSNTQVFQFIEDERVAEVSDKVAKLITKRTSPCEGNMLLY